jgi:hypothetical protein
LDYLGKNIKQKGAGFEIIHYLHLVHLHVLQETKTKHFGGKYHFPPQNFLFRVCVQTGTKLKSKKKGIIANISSSSGAYRFIKQLGPEKSKGYQKICRATNMRQIQLKI